MSRGTIRNQSRDSGGRRRSRLNAGVWTALLSMRASADSRSRQVTRRILAAHLQLVSDPQRTVVRDESL